MKRDENVRPKMERIVLTRPVVTELDDLKITFGGMSMRKILFRGKRTDNGEWVEGAFSPKNSDSLFGPTIDKPSIIKFGAPLNGFWFDVDPETVGQYTGLTDKNGKKIFEGDIMQFTAYGILYTGTVEFTEGCFYVNCKNAGPFLDSAVRTHDALKIGNIHDDPELLEE